MPSAVRCLRLVGVTAAALLAALTACSARPSATTDQPSPVAPPSSTASSPLKLPKDGRPLQPIPSVSPEGFTRPPPGRGLTRYERQRLDWQGCGHGFFCSTMLAPLDYAKPDGTAITLMVAKRPAKSDEPLGSLIINPDYDIVGWDPRGVGRSTPVNCWGQADLDRYFAMDSSPDDAAELQARIDEQTDFGRSCLDRSGALLEHISTMDTVRDLDLLRGLVGDAKLNYFGASYGTRIGALYAEMYPQRVGRMILDGAVDVNNSSKITQVDGFERALHHFAQWCAEDNCRMGSQQDDVIHVIKDFLDRLDQQPLKASDDRTLSQQQGVEAVFYSMYGGTSSWPMLREALDKAVFDKDGSKMLQLADASDRRNRDGSYGQLNYAFPAIRCLDSQDNSVRVAERRLAQESRSAPILGPLNGPDLVCARWPVKSAPKPPKVDVASAPPIMVIGTTGDPATPYEYAQSMARELGSGVLVTLDGEGHLAYGQSACVRKLVVAYLVDDEVPADGTRC
jgi:pimeloyl-ACP methyl ester carboxylesterase